MFDNCHYIWTTELEMGMSWEEIVTKEKYEKPQDRFMQIFYMQCIWEVRIYGNVFVSMFEY
jgi:hypothetical protein